MNKDLLDNYIRFNLKEFSNDFYIIQRVILAFLVLKIKNTLHIYPIFMTPEREEPMMMRQGSR